MTPEERKLVVELFDRLAAIEDVQRDAEAERLIADGLRQAPNAPYALVQTVLVQDEALKRADARIRELEAQIGISAESPSQAGFLDNMRNTFSERRDAPRSGSVPSVRPGGGVPMGVPQGYRPETPPAAGPPTAPAAAGGGGSFLGTAAAAAAGVIGGALLLSSIRSMMGPGSGSGPHASADISGGSTSPWGGSTGNVSGGDLSRQAGLDDVGRPPSGNDGARTDSPQGIADNPTMNADAGNTQSYPDDDEGLDAFDDGGGFDVSD